MDLLSQLIIQVGFRSWRSQDRWAIAVRAKSGPYSYSMMPIWSSFCWFGLPVRGYQGKIGLTRVPRLVWEARWQRWNMSAARWSMLVGAAAWFRWDGDVDGLFSLVRARKLGTYTVRCGGVVWSCLSLQEELLGMLSNHSSAWRANISLSCANDAPLPSRARGTEASSQLLSELRRESILRHVLSVLAVAVADSAISVVVF